LMATLEEEEEEVYDPRKKIMEDLESVPFIRNADFKNMLFTDGDGNIKKLSKGNIASAILKGDAWRKFNLWTPAPARKNRVGENERRQRDSSFLSSLKWYLRNK